MPAKNYLLVGVCVMLAAPMAVAQTTASSCPRATALEVGEYYLRPWGTSTLDLWQESNALPGLQVSNGLCNGAFYRADTCIGAVLSPVSTALCVTEYTTGQL